MRIGVLTGGGDCPGLNAVIRAVVRTCDARYGSTVVGFRDGWRGLLENRREQLKNDDRNDRLLAKGGTMLGTARVNPDKLRAGLDQIKQTLEDNGIDVLIPIGGDDTLSYGERLHREGVKVAAIPKTMDNDVYGTDYCIGFSTAVTRSVEFIHNLRTSAGSHERIAVVELFGRNSGETSLIAAYLAGVDRAIISEVPFDPHRLAEMIMEDKRMNPSNYAMLTVSEGARMIEGEVIQTGEADAYGHKKLGGIGAVVGSLLNELTGENIIYQQVAYLMRSGAPDSLDLMVAANYAQMAMSLVEQGRFGRMVALQRGLYTDININTIMQGIKRVNVAELYDVGQYRPKVRHVFGMPMFLM